MIIATIGFSGIGDGVCVECLDSLASPGKNVSILLFPTFIYLIRGEIFFLIKDKQSGRKDAIQSLFCRRHREIYGMHPYISVKLTIIKYQWGHTAWGEREREKRKGSEFLSVREAMKQKQYIIQSFWHNMNPSHKDWAGRQQFFFSIKWPTSFASKIFGFLFPRAS